MIKDKKNYPIHITDFVFIQMFYKAFVILKNLRNFAPLLWERFDKVKYHQLTTSVFLNPQNFKSLRK